LVIAPYRVLLVDNNADDRTLALRALSRELPALQIREVAERADWEAALAADDFDLLITDYELHWGDGLKVLQEAKQRWPNRPVIMYTGSGSEEIAAQALALGLDDYVIKSTDYSRLVHTVRAIISRCRLETEQELLARFAVELAAVATEKALVEVTREITHQLFDWDAHYFAVRRPKESTYRVLAYFDTIGGEVRSFPPHGDLQLRSGSPLADSASGRSILLNSTAADGEANLVRFGDTSRASECLLFAPVRSGTTVIGILSVQSYTAHKYSEEDLRLLERVADTVAPALERVHAEQVRLESERRYRTLVEASPDAIALVDTDFRILMVNQQACRLHGFDSPEQMIGLDAMELIAPEDRDRILSQNRAAGESADTRRTDLWALRRNGKRVHTELHSSLVRDNEDRQVGFLGIVRDLTLRDEQQRRLEQLRVAHQRQMERLIANLPEGVCLLDKDFKIVLANPVAEQWLPLLAGVKPGEVLTRIGSDSVAGLVERQANGLPQDVVVPGSPERVFSVSFHATPDDEDEDRSWILLLREVTEERRAKEEEAKRNRLTALGQLAGGVAHNFNNILTSIVGYTQLLLLQDDVPEQAKKRLRIIEQESMRAAKLVQQILDFGRRSLAQRVPVNLATVVEDTVKLLRAALPDTIHLTLTVDKGEYTVEADVGQLREMLTNLATNASEAMPQGGTVSLHLSRLSLAADEPSPVAGMPAGDWVLLSVTDTGPGMPGDIREHVFEPFFTTKEIGEGAGLGLAQVYGIVKQHRGYIGVESRAGKGTTFHVYFPALARS